MGIFDAIKRTFNLGGASLSIQLDSPQYHQGEPITGTVRLRGGEISQEADRLRIALVEFWTEERGSGKHRRTVTVTEELVGVTLLCPCPVEAGVERDFPFQFALPLAARLSDADGSSGWRLDAELQVPGAIDPSATRELRVEPALALLQLVSMWLRVLHWREMPDRRRWDAEHRATCFRFQPPTELAGDFDHLDVACIPLPGGDWQASLAFDLQEKSLLDWLKAAVDLDKANRRVYIPADALSGDAPAYNALATELVLLMQGIVEERAKR